MEREVVTHFPWRCACQGQLLRPHKAGGSPRLEVELGSSDIIKCRVILYVVRSDTVGLAALDGL